MDKQKILTDEIKQDELLTTPADPFGLGGEVNTVTNVTNVTNTVGTLPTYITTTITTNPGGGDTQVQFNDGGTTFGTDTDFTWTKGSNTLKITAAGSSGTIQGAAGSSSTAGGSLSITAGAGGSTANGGSLSITSGAAGGTSGNGGDITLTAGNAKSGNTHGNIVFAAGKNSDASGGKTGRYVFAMREGDATGDNAIVYDVNYPGTIYKKIHVGAVVTTNNTATTFSSGFITMAADESVMVEAHVTGRRIGGSAGADGDSAGYVLRGLYQKVGAGSATLIGAVGQTVVAESQGPWDATLVTSSNNVIVQVTGATNNNVSWIAEIEYWYASTTT